jgi:hypothetical protein
VITGDAKGAARAFDQVDKRAKGTEGRLKGFAATAKKSFAVGGVAAGGVVAVGLMKATSAAIEAEKSQARMEAQLKASDISFKRHGGEIDRVIQKTSKLAAVDDEDLQDAFTNIVRTTGNVNQSLKLTGLAADVAAAKNLDLSKAGDLVAKVAGGNTSVLSRYGITIKEGATATEALGVLQQKFAGQAKAYGDTTAGSIDRAKIAVENMGEVIGQKTAPYIEKAATAFSGLITGSNGAGRAVRTAIQWISTAFNNARATVEQFATKNRASINQVIEAVRRVGTVYRDIFMNVLLPVVRRVVEIIVPVLARVGKALVALVGTVVSIINGDWRQAWDRFKSVISNAVGAIAKLIKGAGSLVWDAVTGLGKLIVRGILKGMGNLGHMILDKIKDAANWVKGKVGGLFSGLGSALGIGDGIGRGVGRAVRGAVPSLTAPIGPQGPLAGGSSNLMGAKAYLAPFASVGLRRGLRVSSGLRPGAITSSGNPSNHGTGDAVDLAGSPGAMLSTFKTLKARFGSRLAELIYTPGGMGIKNGRPYQYTGAVAAEHYDHVHVAYTGGDGVGARGPRGDGPGARMSSSGISVAVNAARRAGFKGSDLVRMVAIAGRESNYDPTAQNLKYPDHSIGLWQINQLAHKGRFGTDAQLMNPLTNAKAAYALWKQAGFQPWTTNAGISQAHLDAARRAVLGNRGSTGSSPSSEGRRSSSSSGTSSTTDTPTRYERDLAAADLGIAEATPGGEGPKPGSGSAIRLAKATSAKRRVVGARIRKIRQALRKKGLRSGTRVRLQGELSTLLTEHRQLGVTGQELRHPVPGDTSADGVDAGDPNQALIDSQNALAEATLEAARIQAEATRQHVEALNAEVAERKRQTDTAIALNQTDAYTMKKYLADFFSGMIGDSAVIRRYTAGTGALAAY